MGAFYGSVQIKADDREQILAAAEELAERLAIRCLVGPVISGWVGVYPSTNGQDENVGAALAERLGGTVWHVLVHDSDLLAYWLWHDGTLAVSFNSWPGYFDAADLDREERMTGNAEVLARLLGGDVNELQALLGRGNKNADECLGKFERIVGVKNLATAYEYLKEGETEGIRGWRKFKELPNSALDQKKRAAQVKTQALQALKKRGLLLRHESIAKDQITPACAASGGFLVFRSDLPMRTTRYPAPNASPQDLPWDLSGHLSAVASDASGRRLAIASWERLEIWDATSGQRIRELPDGGATLVAISADGRLVAKNSHMAVKVFDVNDGRLVLSAPCEATSQKLALHPSGDWVVVAHERVAFRTIKQPDDWRSVPLIESTVAPGQEEMRGRKFGSPDIDTLIRVFRERHEQTARAAWEGRTVADEERQRIAATIDEAATKMRLQLETMRRANQLWKHESIKYVGFSRDGRWLWVATNRALWVFEWSDVVTRGESAQATWWFPTSRFEPPTERDEHICAIAEEHNQPAIVVGTWNGRLHRMQLETGEVQELMQWPEDHPWEVMLTPDDRLLGCVCRTRLHMKAFDIRDPSSLDYQDRPSWQIWDYRKLRDEASQPG